MARKVRTSFLLYVVVSVFFCASLYHHFLRPPSDHLLLLPLSPSLTTFSSSANLAVAENLSDASIALTSNPNPNPTVTSPPPPPQASAAAAKATATELLSTTAILLPDWEVLVIVSPDQTNPNLDASFDTCLFDTGEISPARSNGNLPFSDRSTFACLLPLRARRRLPFKQPLLTRSRSPPPPPPTAAPPLLRWTHVAYDSLTAENDVVLFVKGVNVRQGINRSPTEFRCVFFTNDGETNAVRTAVTTSMQEVFRCQRPQLTAPDGVLYKVTLEIVTENWFVPSVAYYTPPRTLASNTTKSLICASTMVYDVAKFLREWIIYHSKIGVEKFLLYDNGSDDDLQSSVNELVDEGFDISTYFWRWPKTQEAGFSHSAIYARDVCSWMLYLDVDEFVYSPNWENFSNPSHSLLRQLITTNSSRLLGQVSIGCHEFGPSGQEVHPINGVTQGYNCRRMYENRHKSIVLLDAIDDSLLNVIHHFHLKPGYKTRKPSSNNVVVNHYKYQAWPEFKAKFRRRVSAYVLDWTQKLNPHSNDRTPGLGFSPVEPRGWPQKFCEVRDDKLKDLVRRWFGVESDSGLKMAWQVR